jgi:hypothetical protein
MNEREFTLLAFTIANQGTRIKILSLQKFTIAYAFTRLLRYFVTFFGLLCPLVKMHLKNPVKSPIYVIGIGYHLDGLSESNAKR